MRESDGGSTARFIGWVTAALLIAALVTGYGITEFRAVTALTFGLLDKATSQQLHSLLAVPTLVLLVLHLGASLRSRRRRR